MSVDVRNWRGPSPVGRHRSLVVPTPPSSGHDVEVIGHRVAVVGAGTTGCIIAARLSEHRDLDVTLFEEGPRAISFSEQRALWSQRPLWSLEEAFDPRSSRHLQVHDDHGPGPVLITGHGPGGSGRVNGGYFIRPTAQDLRRWSFAVGDQGWGDRLLSAMIRSETDMDHRRDRLHGDRGPITVERDGIVLHPVSEAFRDAAIEFGLDDHPDMNDGGTTGVGPVPFNAVSGRLVDPATAYLLPAIGRPNLTLMTGRRVLRVVVRCDRVVGVESHRRDGDGGTELFEADEVILCAGTLGTAGLLFASGIGEPDVLLTSGLEPVVASPAVGRSFWNHPCVDIVYRADDSTLSATGPNDPFMQLVAHTTTGGVGGVDAEYMATRRPYGVVTGQDPSDPNLALRVTLVGSTTTGLIAPRPGGGELDISYATTTHDNAEMGRAVEAARELLTSEAFAQIIPEGVESSTTVPTTAFHMIGSCPMGDDPAASVVDTSFRLHGIDGLRIVDASVIPIQLSRGPSACVVGLGELAANAFLDGWSSDTADG